MFFKRLLGPSAGGSASGSENNNNQQQQQHTESGMNLPAGVQLMSAEMQRKLQSRSIQYNMKVVIRGDRSVGKTSLWRRIQGLEWSDEYVATDEIQVAHISWTYKASDDTVKVEVWDVVDKGKPKKLDGGLKLSNEAVAAYSNVSLDAEFIDVYKGAHCVVFVFDITKQWTMDYVERELARVPHHLPVLIVANRADQSHHRAVPRDRPRVVAETFTASTRPVGSAPVMACEASMRNNFGLRFVHAFLGVPFLVMQRNTLATLMEKNATELEAMNDELTAMLDDPSQSYEAFSDALANKRREKADSLSPAVALANAGAISSTSPAAVLDSLQQQQQQQQQMPSAAQIVEQLVPDQLKPIISNVVGIPIQQTAAPAPPAPSVPTKVALTGVGRGQAIVAGSAASTLSNSSTLAASISSNKTSPQPSAATATRNPNAAASKLGSVDDFVPTLASDANVDSFLSDEPANSASTKSTKKSGFLSMFSSSSSKAASPQPPPPPQVQVVAPAPTQPKPQQQRPKPAVVDSDEEDYSRPQIAGFSEDIDDDDARGGHVPIAIGHASEDTSDDDNDKQQSATRPAAAPVITADFDYDYGDDADFVPPPPLGYDQPSPRTSRSSTTTSNQHHRQQSLTSVVPPSPPSFDYAPRSGSVASSTGGFNPPPLVASQDEDQASFVEQQQPPSVRSSAAASFSSSIAAAAPLQVDTTVLSPSARTSSTPSLNSNPKQVAEAGIWDDYEEDHDQRAASFTDSPVGSTTSSLKLQPQHQAVSSTALKLSDSDFAFLEQRSSGSKPTEEDSLSSAAVVKKTKKKASSKTASSDEPTSAAGATKKKASKTSSKTSTPESASAASAKTKKTKKQASQQQQSFADDDDASYNVAPAASIGKSSGKLKTASPSHQQQQQQHSVAGEGEDDLESFLNS